jgi:outer membrane protein TolC
MKLKYLILMIMACAHSFAQEKELSYFLEKATYNSPLLKDYSNQIKLAAIDSLLFKATRKPQISGNLATYYAPIIKGYGYDTALSNGQSVAGLVGLNQSILSKNQVNAQLETIHLLKEGLSINKKIAIKDLDNSIISQYITASGSKDQIKFNQEIILLLNQETAILKKLTQNSIYKQTDYLIFKATVKQQELLLLQLKQQYRNDVSLLNYLVGETDTTLVQLKKPEIVIKSIARPHATIFFKQFAIDSLKIENQNKLIDNRYKPSMAVVGDAGYWSSFANQGYRNFGFSVGFGLSIPLYDGNQRTLAHQKNEVALATNVAYKNNFDKQYQQQLLILNQKMQQLKEVDLQLQSQLQIIEALIEANKKLLVSGDAQITEYIIAVGNLIALKNAISQNNSSKLQIVNQINYWSFND